MILPKNVNNLIARLEGNGFKAYAVGGCVRDSVMGLTPKDWDICSSARPEELTEVFGDERVIKTGLRHGTLTVLLDRPYEITSFRVDGEYLDHRHPEGVTFTDDITLDLSRRDFTINAIAYNPSEGFIDPFGGAADIKNGIIRAVGDPEARFEEDALRIMRGLRFCCVTGFSIDESTAKAMKAKAPLLKNISAERVASELVRAITEGKVYPAFEEFSDIICTVIPLFRPCIGFEQDTPHHVYDVYGHILRAVDNYSGGDPAVKLALLFHDISKPQCRKIYGGQSHFKGHSVQSSKTAGEIMRRLKMSRRTIASVTSLIKFHDVRLTGGIAQMRKLVSVLGAENMGRVLDIMYADALAQSEYMRREKLALLDKGRENLRLITEGGLCCSLGELELKGNHLKEAGLKGKRINAALRYALNGVMNGSVPNERDALSDYVEGFLQKNKFLSVF